MDRFHIILTAALLVTVLYAAVTRRRLTDWQLEAIAKAGRLHQMEVVRDAMSERIGCLTDSRDRSHEQQADLVRDRNRAQAEAAIFRGIAKTQEVVVDEAERTVSEVHALLERRMVEVAR